MHIEHGVDAKRARYCTITKRTENIVIMSSGEHTQHAHLTNAKKC